MEKKGNLADRFAQTPRPIGFCSTVDAQGVHNLAPFSYFNLVGHKLRVVDPNLYFVSLTFLAVHP